MQDVLAAMSCAQPAGCAPGRSDSSRLHFLHTGAQRGWGESCLQPTR